MSEIIGECVNDPGQRPGPLKKVGDRISGKADDQQWRIFVTGHSMGGSKATLCAYELAVGPAFHRRVQAVCVPSDSLLPSTSQSPCLPYLPGCAK